MGESGSGRGRSVREIMSHPVITASPDETVVEAANRMREHQVGSVVVAEDDRPLGILTERDLVRMAASSRDPSGSKVSEWMTETPEVIEADHDVTEAFATFHERNFRHLPVVSAGKLVGIVSLRDLMRVARIQPVDTPAGEVPKGLEGVAVAETEMGDVRGQEGFYHYRQYNAVELAEKRTLEDVWYLLYNGELPTKAEREEFIEEIRPLRNIPEPIMELLPSIARMGEHFIPMDALRSAYSLLGTTEDFRPWLDEGQEALRKQGMRTCALFPTLVMALYRLNKGRDPIDPHPELPYGANYLYMLRGEEPDPDHARAVEQYLIATIDHGFNASTFTARVITSTGADMCSAVVGALGALSGPLHGGAPSRALDMLEDIGSPEAADAWLRNAVESGKRLMGFGHRVYKTDDPRSVMLRGVAERLDGERVEFAKLVEKRAVEILQELKPGRNLYPNVEFYAGIVMDMIGMPRELFTPTFAVSRVIGWTAHIMEQASDNRLIRPSARYVGPPPPQEVPAVD